MIYNTSSRVGLAALAFASILVCADSQAAVFASRVVEYQPGSGASLTDPQAALGQPGPIVGAGSGFDAVLSPFNPHYEGSEIVQIGEGGQLTLQLANEAVVIAGVAEIGVFANAGIADIDWPNGTAGADLEAEFATFGIDSARVEVSADGVSWFDLGLARFDQPTNFYADLPAPSSLDTAGLTAADFGQSHSNTLADYAGKQWPELSAQFGGSAGGTWIDLDATGLGSVGWIRFSLADDNDPGTDLTFDLNAVSVENRAVGAVVPEPSTLLLALTALSLTARRKR